MLAGSFFTTGGGAGKGFLAAQALNNKATASNAKRWGRVMVWSSNRSPPRFGTKGVIFNKNKDEYF